MFSVYLNNSRQLITTAWGSGVNVSFILSFVFEFLSVQSNFQFEIEMQINVY